MPSQFRLVFCRSFFLLSLIVLTGNILSCKTASKLSLEEAQKISVVGKDGVAPPPRAGVMDLINPKYLENFKRVSCNDAPPEQLDIDHEIKGTQEECDAFGWRSGLEFCLSDRLFEKGRGALNRGQYADAIILIEAALDEDKGAGYERYRPLLATSYAAIGDFSAARRHMGGGDSKFYRTVSGKYQVAANYQVGQATMNRILGKYQKAEHHYRKALKLCEKGRDFTKDGVFSTTMVQIMPDFGEVLRVKLAVNRRSDHLYHFTDIFSHFK